MATGLSITTRQRIITRLIQLTIASYAGFCTHIVYAGPNGENIVGGIGEVVRPSADLTQINQSSNRLAIDWNRFDVANGETVRFVQPNQSSIVLNRIFDNKASEILGSLQANGQVFLVNPRGIVFGQNAVVQVGGLLATDLMLDPADFINGTINLNDVPGLQGSIQNQGMIAAASGGSVVLLGHVVDNNGEIYAPDGKVVLASGSSAVISFDENSQLGVAVDQGALNNLTGSDTAIKNSGKISAEGGQVLLSAKAGADVFTQAVNNTGVIEATSVRQRNGVIEIIADGDVNLQGALDVSSGNVSSGDVATSAGRVSVQAKNIAHNGSIKADSQTGNGGQIELFADDTVIVNGDANISARSDQAKGGAVHIVGNRTGILDRTAIDASGDKGGGEILIGGDFQGAAIDGDRTSTRTVVSRDAEIKADAITTGDGGKVIVWADDTTLFKGEIFARGGALNGDGGFVEVSGKNYLGFDGFVDTTAAYGAMGDLLLDPDQITIVNGAGGANDAELVDSQILRADGGGANWTVSETVVEAVASNLKLEANQSITINNLTDNVLNLASTGTVTFSVRNTAGAAIFTMNTGDTINLSGGAAFDLEVLANNDFDDSNITLGNIIASNSVRIFTDNTLGGFIAAEKANVNIAVGDITVTGNHNVSVNGYSKNTNTASSDDAGAITISTGNISISGSGDVNVSAIAQNDNTDTPDGNNISVTTGTINIGGSGDVDIVGKFILAAGLDQTTLPTITLNLNNITVGASGAGKGDISILADHPLTVGGNATETINLTGTTYGTQGDGTDGDITIDGHNILLGANTTISTRNGGGTGADITLTANTINAQNNDLTLNVGSGLFNVNFSTISNMDALSLTTSRDIYLGDVAGGGGDQSFSQANIDVLDNATALTLKSDGNILVSDTNIASGAVTLQADQDDNNAGSLTVSATKTLSKTTAGTLTLDGYNATINGAVTRSGAGAIILSPENLITLGANGSLASNGGDITLSAATVTMTDGATINSGAGTIAVTAANNATISGLTSTNNTTSAVTVTSTAGSILDAGDTNTDITATNASARVNLNGATGVGAFADPLSLNATTAQVVATAGDIAFSNTGAMTLNTITANAGGINISSSGNMTVSGAITATGAGNDVSLTSTAGTFTANAAITSGAGGDITLVSTLGNSTINTAVDSNGGSLTINAGDDLSFGASTNLQSDNGNIVLAANIDADTDGAITLNAASVVNAGTGTIALTAYENIALTGLTTTNATNSAVTVTSTNGVISDAGDASTDISAINGRAVLNSQTTIGSGDALDLSVNQIDITSDVGGVLNIINNRALSVIQAISNGVGGAIDIIVNNDAILTIAGTVDSNSGAINLRADDDVTVNAAVAINLDNGNVTLRADNDSDVNGTGGAVNLNATSTLNVGSGTITIQADESIAVAGLTTTNATSSAVTITSTSGAINDAGDTSTDISAINGRVVLNSQNNIGSGNALDLSIAQLDATNDAGGVINIINDRALSIIQAISNGVGGAIDIIVNSDASLTVAGLVTSNSGAINLRADDDLILTSAAAITSANGNVTLRADNNNNANGSGGALTFDAASSLSVGSGTINLQADETIALTGLATTNNTTSAVTVTSTSGAITDGGDTLTDISAINGRAVLNSQTGIGSGNALELAVAEIDATNDASAAINLTNNQTISIIRASSLGGAIDLATSAGNIIVENAAGNGLGIASSNGAISVNSAGALTVEDNATALINAGSGTINLTALNAIALTGLTTTNATTSAVTVTSTNGAITDGGNTASDISAVNGRAVLNSQTGIGSGNALELAVAEIDATNDASAAITITNNQNVSIIRAASLGGAINFTTSAGNIIVENAAGNGLGITSSNGAISVNSAGALTVEDNATALINAGSGTINLTALNAIALTGLTTTNATSSAVTVTSTNGAITDAGDTVTDISAINGRAVLNSQTTIGSGDALDLSVNQIDITSDAGGVLNIINNRALSVIQAISNGVGGAIDIIVNNDASLTIAGTVDSNSGAINLRADDDVTVNAAVAMNSDNGNVTLRADNDSDVNGTGGAVNLNATATLNVGSGTITIQADESIAVAGLTTTNATSSAVTITSTSGAITDGGTTDISAVNGRVVLNSQTGIGSGDALELAVAEIDATNDASAAINLTNNQNVSIIRAASLGGVIDLATSAGNIIIENAAGNGLGIASSNGAIGVNSAGTLTVEDNATALINAGSGTINLTALNAIALTGLITTNATTSAITVTSTNGAITDGGNTSTDISAVNGRAVLVAKTGIGTAGAGALDVNLNSFSATNSVLNSTGGIFINAAGDLNVVQADANTSGAASDGITISSQGNLTLSGLIVANIGGSGNQIALQSADDMTFANTSSVVSADGAIVITADTNTNANGGITMIDGATINSGLNTLTMTAAETIALSGLTSTNISTSAVTVTSTAGAITDAGDSVADITATALGARVNLNAATGIGNGNAIDTTIDTLAAANSGANGITVIDSDGLILNDINAATGNVAITANGLTLNASTNGVIGATVNLNAGSGAITDARASAGNDITATDLILTAATGIGSGNTLEIDADTLVATNTGANGITVTDSDNLSLNNIDAAADNIAITANGLTLNTSTNGVIGATVNLNAGSGAITDARASAGNDITATDLTLTATSGIGLGNTIEIDANTLTATNSGANGITVIDSDNLSLNNIDATAGNIAITAVGLALNTSTNGVQGATVNLNAGTGAITDSRASAGNDITATDLILTATSGIGSGNTLEIDTDNLTATNSAANGITLTDSDGVAIVGATSSSGAIAITSSTGNLSTSGAITTTGAITLIATTGNATINSLLDSNGSALTLTSGDDLALGASANLQSDNGNILLTANAAPDNVDNNGGITFNAASVVNAGSGSITLTSYETISLTGLTTTGSATITSSNGAITDAGDTATDVTAASLTLSAATGIGVATTAPLEFSVTTLNATTTSGDIAYSNSGDITLGATSTTNGAIDITASGNLTAGAAVTTTGLNNGVKLTSATGNLQVDGAVTAGTNGAILLESTLGNSTINSTLDSNGGTLTLTAGDDIALGASANLQSDNGNILLTANTDADTNGGISMNTASVTNAGSGAITLNGYETISLTGLTTTGSVSVTSTNAAITDAGNTNTDIVANDLTFNAVTGIGLGNALEIDADSLTATNSGANGITITDSDNLSLNNIDAAADDVTIAANGLTLNTSTNGVIGATVNLNAGTGAITDARASAGNDITATDLIVTATSGIGSANTLEIDADTLTATNSSAGNIRLTDSDDLALNLIDNNTRAVFLISGGALTDNNAGANNIIAGALTLTASTGIGSGDAIEIDADSLTSTNTVANGITITDSDDLALNLIFSSTGAVTLSSGGALTDNNAGANNVVTTDLTLTAATGIGSGNAIETDLNTLTATNTGANGITITEADDLALNLIDANSGAVTLDSGGALTDNNAAANNIVAGVLTLTAVDGIGAGNAIEIDADQLTATNTSANGITIADSDNLSLNNIDATTGNIAITAVGLTLNGLITGATVNLNTGTAAIADGNGVSNNIAATDLILAATTGIGAGDALEIDTDNLTATNSGANGITLTDSDDVVIVGATSSSGAIAITSSTGNLSTSGAVTTTGAISLAAITGNATINSLLDTNGSALSVTAGDDLALGASANLQSDNGAIAVTANTDADTDGGIVMTDGAQINSTTGTLTLSAYESIALTGLTSTNTSNSAITVTTTNGAITDAGDSNTDVTATAVGSRVNLNAATGIGAFANPLELNVLNLAATTTSGDLAFANAGAITLDGVTTNNGAINIGASGDLTVASGGVTATGASNGVSLTSSGGNFVANGAITAGSNGIILLDATTGNNTINATVDSNGGALTVSAGDDIALGVSANLQSDNGAINLTANAAPDNVDNNGGITFNAASLVNAGSGAITLSSYETISLTGLATTGSVSVTSTNAAITDAGNTNVDIVANGLTLNAVTGIGFGNALEIDADSLTAANSGANGITVTDSDNLSLNNIDAAADNVTIAANGLTLNASTNGVIGATVNLNAGTGAITDSRASAGNDITATDLILTAATGIGSANTIEIDADTLTATNSGANGITVTDSDNLSLNNIDAAAGDVTIAANDLTLNASTNGVIGAIVNLNSGSGAITDARASAGNDITATDLILTAATGIGSANTIEIDADTLTATNSGANGITVTDSDNLSLNNIDAAAGDVTIAANGLTLNTSTNGVIGAIVNLNAGSGAITDARASAGNDITATDLILTAATGIGSANTLEIDADTLTATNSGANGITVTDSDNLSLNNIDAAAGNIAITAVGLALNTSTNGVIGTIVSLNAGSGAITDARASAGNDITATDLILSATTGIGSGNTLEIDADTLTATNSGANGIAVIDSDNLSLNNIDAAAGNIAISANGLTLSTSTNGVQGATVNLNAGTSAITDARASAGNDITATDLILSATTGIGSSNTLEIDADTLIATNSGANGITVTDSDDLSLNNIDAASGNIAITAVGLTLNTSTTGVQGATVNLNAGTGAIFDSRASAGNDITATDLILTATTGIGSGNALEIDADTLTATNSGANGITVTDSDNLILNAINAAVGNIAIIANGLTLDGLLTGTTVNINAGTGAISDGNAAVNNIAATDLILTATTGIGSGDAIEINAASLTATNSGANGITVTDSDDLALNLLDANTGAVIITSTTGALTDNNAGSNNIVAAALTLNAATGIGSGDALEIDADILTATNSGANGITVTDSDDLALNNIDAAAGNVAITANGLTINTSTNGVIGATVNLNAGTGAITDARASAGNDITATDLILTATTGIGSGNAVEIDADTLTATNSGANGITITDSANLSLNNVDAAAGNIAIVGNGLTLNTSTNGVQGATVNLNAGSGAIVDARASAGNDITATNVILTATNGIGDGNVIEVDTNTLATSNATNATQLIDSDELTINSANGGSGIIAITAQNNITLTGVTTTNATNSAVTIISTTGSIMDAGESVTDIAATTVGSQVTLTAATGIGTFANPLDLDVLNLLVTTTSGDLAFSNTGALTLDGVATNNGGINISAGGDLTVAVGGVAATGANNGVSLTSVGGNLVANGAVTSGANGVVILAATSGNNIINSTLDSNGGALTVTAGDDLNFTANANVQSDNGNIIFTANTNADTNGGMIFNSAAVTNAGSGTITLTAYEDIVLSGLTTSSSANNAVVVTSTNGAITDAGNAATDVSAVNGRAILNSQSGIGSGDVLELSVAQLDASNDTGGVINIINDRALTLVQAISNGIGGAIDVVVGNDAVLTLAGAVSSNGGTINLHADDDLIVNSAVAINSNGGAINLIADNDADANGSGGAINFAVGSILQAGGGDVVANADELIQLATLNGVDDLVATSDLNRFTGVATVNTLTVNGDAEIAANLTTLVGGMNFTNLIFSNSATLNSAAQLQATSLQLANSGLAVLQSGSDADVTVGSIVGSGQSLQINSAAGITLGASNIGVGDITLTADSNNNQVSVITLTTLDAGDVVIQGSAALDDQLIDTSNTINAQSFVARQLNVADLQSITSATALTVEANTINLSNNLSSGSAMSLAGGNINLLNSVLLATTYNSAGARMSLRGSLNGNGKNLQLNAGNDVICCDQLTINNVDQLTVINSARTVFGRVSTLGNIEINASRQIYLNDNMFSAGNIVLNANSDLDGSGIVGLLQGKTLTAHGTITVAPGSLQTLLEAASCDLNEIPDVLKPIIPDPLPEVDNPLDTVGPQEFLSSLRTADSTSSRTPSVSYLNMGCNAESGDASRRKECQDESSMMDFLGTFLIDNQLPSR